MKKIIFILMMIVILFSGCSTNKATVNSFVEPTYRTGQINTIAMFPIRNAQLAPSEARAVNKKIIKAMNSKNPNLNIIAPSKVIRIINESNLASEWANFIDDYYTSGIADKTTLLKFSKLLNCDAIFQGQLLKVSQRDGSRTVPAVTRVSVEFTIIENRTAKVIWNVTSDGIRAESAKFGQFTIIAPAIQEAIDLSIVKVSNNIPNL